MTSTDEYLIISEANGHVAPIASLLPSIGTNLMNDYCENARIRVMCHIARAGNKTKFAGGNGG